MAKFVFVYHGGGAPESEAEGAAVPEGAPDPDSPLPELPVVSGREARRAFERPHSHCDQTGEQCPPSQPDSTHAAAGRGRKFRIARRSARTSAGDRPSELRE